MPEVSPNFVKLVLGALFVQNNLARSPEAIVRKGFETKRRG
jgi:hypothetical protein